MVPDNLFSFDTARQVLGGGGGFAFSTNWVNLKSLRDLGDGNRLAIHTHITTAFTEGSALAAPSGSSLEISLLGLQLDPAAAPISGQAALGIIAPLVCLGSTGRIPVSSLTKDSHHFFWVSPMGASRRLGFSPNTSGVQFACIGYRVADFFSGDISTALFGAGNVTVNAVLDPEIGGTNRFPAGFSAL